MEARGNEEEAGVQTAIATVSLSGTLNEKLEAIAKAQFRGVEMFENDLLSRALQHQARGPDNRQYRSAESGTVFADQARRTIRT